MQYLTYFGHAATDDLTIEYVGVVLPLTYEYTDSSRNRTTVYYCRWCSWMDPHYLLKIFSVVFVLHARCNVGWLVDGHRRADLEVEMQEQGVVKNWLV